MNTTIQYVMEHIQPVFSHPGTFLEIGCWDGELLSQTAFLERDLGWHGFCVDPFPRNFTRRNCAVIPRAISRDGKPRTFVKVSIDRRNGGDVSYFSGFKDSLGLHLDVIMEHCDYEELEIETISFKDLCRQYQLPHHIEFLSVDTEGSELEVFESVDFGEHSFDVIIFEHNFDVKKKAAIQELLWQAGYRPYAELYIDSVMVRRPA